MIAPSPAFRRLALATGIATFLLIILGGIVRVSDSGLGCGPAGSGFHGWPLCGGELVPGVETAAIIEYAHRAAATVVGLLMVAVAVIAWRHYRAQRGIVLAATAAVVLVAAQGLLGAATVEENLEEALVAAHLGLAMLLLALVVYIWRASRAALIGAPPVDGGPRFRALGAAAQGALFLTIVAGGYMAGTQNYGRPDYRLGDGAHHACGREFPTCNGDFLPFGQARLVDIHLIHRLFMYLATILIVVLVITAIRRRPSPRVVRMAWIAAALLAVQALLGALNVWLEEYELLILAHLTLATLLWAHLFALNLQLYRVRSPAPEPLASDARGPAEAAPA